MICPICGNKIKKSERGKAVFILESSPFELKNKGLQNKLIHSECFYKEEVEDGSSDYSSLVVGSDDSSNS